MVQLSSSGVCFAVCFILFWINILIGLKKKAAVQKQEDVKFTVTDILQKVSTLIQFISFMSLRTFARTEFRSKDTACIYVLNRMLGVMLGRVAGVLDSNSKVIAYGWDLEKN